MKDSQIIQVSATIRLFADIDDAHKIFDTLGKLSKSFGVSGIISQFKSMVDHNIAIGKTKFDGYLTFTKASTDGFLEVEVSGLGQGDLNRIAAQVREFDRKFKKQYKIFRLQKLVNKINRYYLDDIEDREKVDKLCELLSIPNPYKY